MNALMVGVVFVPIIWSQPSKHWYIGTALFQCCVVSALSTVSMQYIYIDTALICTMAKYCSHIGKTILVRYRLMLSQCSGQYWCRCKFMPCSVQLRYCSCTEPRISLQPFYIVSILGNAVSIPSLYVKLYWRLSNWYRFYIGNYCFDTVALHETIWFYSNQYRFYTGKCCLDIVLMRETILAIFESVSSLYW